jgi:ribosomal protection tetracycline resistance protein
LKKLNIGIIAHVDAGKTTLTENILFLGGVISKKGRVDSGDTQTDSLEVERRRGISVRAAATSFYRNGVKINLIDTPGHVDFIAEVERSLAALDGVVLVVSAKEGLQSQTRVLMDAVAARKIPAVIFINKIDRQGAEPQQIAAMASAYMGGRLVYVNRPLTDGKGIEPLPEDKFISLNRDALYTLDDGLMEDYVNGREAAFSRFYESMADYARQGLLYPVLYGSALFGIGIEELLNMLPQFLPLQEESGADEATGIVFKVDNSGPEKLVYVRLFKGELSLRRQVKFRGKEEKIARLSRLENGRLVAGNSIEAGDIGVLYFKDLKAGDIIGTPDGMSRHVSLGRPTLTANVFPVNPEQQRALYEALSKLADEDPMLDLTVGKSLSVSMFGEIQMEILDELLAKRYKIPVTFSDALTIYMETPVKPAQVRAPIYRSSYPFAAGVGFRVEPLPRGSGLVYVSEVSFGDLTKTFQNAVEEAVYETCRHGTYGWEITDARVVFDFMQFDSVNGTPSAYRDITPPVLMEAFVNAGMELLEPVLEFELRVPAHVAGKALFDCERMRAVIHEAVTPLEEDGIKISGLVPAETCKNYAAQVASYTEGQGMFLTKFHGYVNTEFDRNKVNEEQINLAANKAVYLLHKLGAR